MSTLGTVGVGIIGAGMISDAYLENLTRFPDLEVRIIGDLDTDRAQEKAAKWGVQASGSAQDVLDRDDIEIIVNLTIPAAHADVAMAALRAGKHVWTEKPISVDRESGNALLGLSRETGLRVGIAPDTVLGPGIQTALRAIKAGRIGQPISASTVMQYVGPDIMHPNPEFLFIEGAGPLFDMGPYYLTTLVHAFGPVSRVAGRGSTARSERVIRAGERAGATFPVSTPTYVAALIEFEQGGVGQSTFSFDSPLTRNGVVEIAGTEGTIIVPDPNRFTGPIRIYQGPKEFPWPTEQPFEEIEPVGSLTGRGLGVLDMARAIREDRPHIATGELGFHILDTMVAIDESMSTDAFVKVGSTVDKVSTLPADFDPFAKTF